MDGLLTGSRCWPQVGGGQLVTPGLRCPERPDGRERVAVNDQLGPHLNQPIRPLLPDPLWSPRSCPSSLFLEATLHTYTYLPTCLPTYLPACLPSYTSLPTCLPTYLLYLPSYPPACLPTYTYIYSMRIQCMYVLVCMYTIHTYIHTPPSNIPHPHPLARCFSPASREIYASSLVHVLDLPPKSNHVQTCVLSRRRD